MVTNSLKRNRNLNSEVNKIKAEREEEEICTGVLRATPRVTCYWKGRDMEKSGREQQLSR